MAHMCTHLPPDPKFVLALRITEEVFNTTYQTISVNKKGRPATLKGHLGKVLVVAVDSEIPWGVMDPSYFEEEFETVENWSQRRFTLCKAKEK